ncbi:MAG: tetratricopeptide repeat protein, partial [Bacteroidota bacterium]|nr:tetratricopeptide repeat protein [Bacteroidota bacterium]
GKTTQARKILERILGEDPADDRARALLARSWLGDDPRKAAEIVAPIEPGSKYEEVAEAVRTYADLLATDESTLPDAPVRPLFVQALRAYRTGDFDEALEKFIEVIRRDRWYHEDAARKACISVFKLLGEDHEITLKHRKDFNRSLY